MGTVSLTDIPVYTPNVRGLYPGLLTDTQGNTVAFRSLYTMSPTDILVYNQNDSPLYPGLETYIGVQFF